MSGVEVSVDNDLLPHYEIMKPFIGGPELRRHTDPFADHVTVITLDMDEAPVGATTMEIIMERVLHKGARIVSATYHDKAGQVLTTIERPADSGWIHQL